MKFANVEAAKAVARGYGVIAAKAQYRMGGADPRTGIDCSGFTRWCWLPFFALPHYTSSQMHAPGVAFKRHSRWARMWLRGGDLVFYYEQPDGGAGHVALHVGIKKKPGPLFGKRVVIQATNEQRGCEEVGIDELAKPFGYGLVGR
jgi:cell wall-associated NlpC family hydrolase